MASRRIRGLLLSICLLWTTPSWAGPVLLDQFYIPTSVPSGGVLAEDTETLAQTFTVGLAGLLTAIELELRCCDGLNGVTFPAEDLVIEIRTTLVDGLPSDHVLFATRARSTDLSVDSFQFERFSLGSQKFRVEPGDVLAIVLSSKAPPLGLFNPYAWNADVFGSYDRGQGYFDRGAGFLDVSRDFGFKTYVPEPASLMLIALAGAAIAGRRTVRSRSRRGRGACGSNAARN